MPHVDPPRNRRAAPAYTTNSAKLIPVGTTEEMTSERLSRSWPNIDAVSVHRGAKHAPPVDGARIPNR